MSDESNVSKMEHELEELRRMRKAALNMLAVMHGDGGHHTANVGFVQSCKDAEKRFHERYRRLDVLMYVLKSDDVLNVAAKTCRMQPIVGTEAAAAVIRDFREVVLARAKMLLDGDTGSEVGTDDAD